MRDAGRHTVANWASVFTIIASLWPWVAVCSKLAACKLPSRDCNWISATLFCSVVAVPLKPSTARAVRTAESFLSVPTQFSKVSQDGDEDRRTRVGKEERRWQQGNVRRRRGIEEEGDRDRAYLPVATC